MLEALLQESSGSYGTTESPGDGSVVPIDNEDASVQVLLGGNGALPSLGGDGLVRNVASTSM